jgi:hypothetical protein
VSPEFNANFYIVAATINPIFFLALTLQGSFYGGLIEKINDDTDKTVKATQDKRIMTFKDSLRVLIMDAALLVAIAIIVAGVGGEIVALVALYHQTASTVEQAFIFWSTVGVISITAVTPALALYRAFDKNESATMEYFIITWPIIKDLFKPTKEDQGAEEAEGQTPKEVESASPPDSSSSEKDNLS